MAQSKKITIKDIRAHLFISIIGNHVELVYHDDFDNGAGLGAALTSIMEEDEKLFDIFSAALLTTIESREKNSNWEKVTFPKKKSNPKQSIPKGATEGKPFVKTRKKATK